MGGGRMRGGGMEGGKKGKVFEGGKFRSKGRIFDCLFRDLLVIDKDFELKK